MRGKQIKKRKRDDELVRENVHVIQETTRTRPKRFILQPHLTADEENINAISKIESYPEAPEGIEEIFEAQEVDHIAYIEQRRQRYKMIRSLLDASSGLLDGIPEECGESLVLEQTIKTLQTKCAKTSKRLESYRKSLNDRESTLKNPKKLTKKLITAQKQNYDIGQTHKSTTTDITIEQLLGKTTIEDFKATQDPILMKYLTLLFDGIYGNKVQHGTSKMKEHRFCVALEMLHKAHNSKYTGRLSLRACLIAYLTTHSKVHHNLLQTVLASGTYETIRQFTNSKLSDFKEIPR